MNIYIYLFIYLFIYLYTENVKGVDKERLRTRTVRRSRDQGKREFHESGQWQQTMQKTQERG